MEKYIIALKTHTELSYVKQMRGQRKSSPANHVNKKLVDNFDFLTWTPALFNHLALK